MSDITFVKAADLLRRLRRRSTRLGIRHEEIEGKGSHLRLRHGDRTTVLPMHRGDIPAGTYRAIPKQFAVTEMDLED